MKLVIHTVGAVSATSFELAKLFAATHRDLVGCEVTVGEEVEEAFAEPEVVEVLTADPPEKTLDEIRAEAVQKLEAAVAALQAATEQTTQEELDALQLAVQTAQADLEALN